MSVKVFGDFEFDEERMQLRREGSPVSIHGQCLEMLILMIERPGDVVTREEIRRRLWPDSTVDFEHSLDVLMSRLRVALGDDRKSARYIQTVPKRGYRFVEPVRVASVGDAGARHVRWVRRLAPYAAVAVLAGCFALWFDHTRYDKVGTGHGRATSPSRR
jgi:DNA-binding winged helix-turn-helix (wHTH) protein